MEQAVTLIQEVGFPIAAAIGLGWFIYKLVIRIVDGMEQKLDVVDEKVAGQINAIEERLGTKLDAHLVRLGNVDKKYKKLINHMQEDIVDVNLLFVVDGVRLSRKKRNSTIETEGLPQLKLVCEIVDPDKVSTPES